MNTRLALNAFEHNSAHITRVFEKCTMYRIHVIHRNMNETIRQRSKCLLLCRLCCCRKGCKGTTMEATVHGDNGLAARSFFFGIQTRKLNSAFICLCAGVREEHGPRCAEKLRNARVEQIRNDFCYFATIFDVVIVAYMNQSLCLRGDCLRYRRVTMT